MMMMMIMMTNFYQQTELSAVCIYIVPGKRGALHKLGLWTSGGTMGYP
jgi:hypothetical protein